MAAAAAVVVCAWPAMVGASRASRAQIARLEAVAVWTESLRDTIAGSIGLEEAIRNSADAAPPAIRAPLDHLNAALAVHVPLPEALAEFAEEFQDESVDLVAAALILNSRLRGPGPGGHPHRARRPRSARSSTCAAGSSRTARTCVAAPASSWPPRSGSPAFVAVFSRAYMAPYATIGGQVVLALVVAIFVTGMVWMRRLAEPRRHERFLSPTTPPRAGSRHAGRRRHDEPAERRPDLGGPARRGSRASPCGC